MIKGNIDKVAVKTVERLAWCQSYNTTCVDDMLTDGQSYEELMQDLHDAYATLREMLSVISSELEETGNAIDYLRHKRSNN